MNNMGSHTVYHHDGGMEHPLKFICVMLRKTNNVLFMDEFDCKKVN